MTHQIAPDHLYAERPRTWLRVPTLVAGIVVLFIRMPINFEAPQLWAEDNVFLTHCIESGLNSLWMPVAGYLCLSQFLVFNFVLLFPLVYAAGLAFYVSIASTLVVMYQVTSPRIYFPAKYLMALTIVLVPMGFEEVGTMTNLQWILPIGAFTMLFMDAHRSSYVLAVESVFMAVMGLSGPFSILLCPLIGLRCRTATQSDNRCRLLALTLICGVTAIIQIYVIVRNPTGPLADVPFSKTLWLTLPISRVMTDFGPLSYLVVARSGFICCAGAAVLIISLVFLRGFREEKVYMLLFSAEIAISGMYKFHNLLGTQINATRYFYVGSIFLIWIMILCGWGRLNKITLYVSIFLLQLRMLSQVYDTPRVPVDLQWPAWAKYADKGLSVVVPGAPLGWSAHLVGNKSGALAPFQLWMNTQLSEHPEYQLLHDCTGEISGLRPLDDVNEILLGDLQNSPLGSTVALIIVTDEKNKIISFGLPKVSRPEDQSPATDIQNWTAVLPKSSDHNLNAYAINQATRSMCSLIPLSQTVDKLYRNVLMSTINLDKGVEVSQKFWSHKPIRRISINFVTDRRIPASYGIQWQITLQNEILGRGTLYADKLSDWQRINLPIRAIGSETVEPLLLRLTVPADVQVSSSIALPVFPISDPDSTSSLTVNGRNVSSNGILGVELSN